jgi:hypothetical protein
MSRSSFRSKFYRFRKRQWLRPQANRAQAIARWTMVLSYAVLALGISLPAAPLKSTDQPYPCMNHRCGCKSAEECWRNCCCTTLEERLVWARENHVTPPDYALAAARAQGIEWAAYWPRDPNQQNSQEMVEPETVPKQTACQASAVRCPFCQRPTSECVSCSCERCTKRAAVKENHSTNGVVLIEALKCQGAGDNWQGLAISLPPPVAIQVRFPDETSQRIRLSPLSFASLSFPPDVPPPRFLVAVNNFDLC